MRRTNSRCHAVFSVALGLSLLAAAGRDTAAQEVTWELFDTQNDPGNQNDKRVACGLYGVYHLEVENALPGSIDSPIAVPRTKGSEVPRRYPRYLGDRPAPGPVEPGPVDPGPLVPSGTLSSPRAGRSARPWMLAPVVGPISPTPLPEDPPWFPCDLGHCFGDPTHFSPDQPWVAVIDWDNPHGWAVGWTIHQVAGPGVKLGLFPLTDPELEAEPRRGENDVHLLTRLCALAEMIDLQGATPPLVVNMSFGRKVDRLEDLEPAGACDPERITCQIALVIEYLRQRSRPALPSPGTMFVAAAGNHQKLLYPAATPGVVAAGSLDLAAFWATRTAVKSWETPKLPSQAAALMPGYGICLFPGTVPQAQKGHPIPPGTSFATATFSGFLVAPLLAGQVQGPLDPVLWTPVASCTADACSYKVVHGSQVYGVSRGLELLLEQQRTSRPACRSPNEGSFEVLATTFNQPLSLAALPALSFDDVAAAERKQPAPHGDPCVPCSGHNQPPPLLALGFASAASRSTLSSPLDLELDMSFAGGLPEGFGLQSLLLRVEDQLYPLNVEGGLQSLQSGRVDRLLVNGAGELIRPGIQPSLVLFLSDDLERNDPFWTSIPIIMH